MLKAFWRSFNILLNPIAKRALFLSLTLSILLFTVIWLVSDYILLNTSIFELSWIEKVSDFFGAMLMFLLFWLLFPGVFSASVSLFVNQIALEIEKQYYPDLAPVKDIPIADNLLIFLRFFVTLICLNLFSLVVFIIFTPGFPIIFLIVNGYLISREYFELVALRRLDTNKVQKLQKLYKTKLLFLGVVIAGLLMIPLINLVAPFIATSVMVHMIEEWKDETPLIRAIN